MSSILRVLVLLLGALAAAPSSAEKQPEPRVVLVERDPWLMVLGSDSTTFALYSDGLTIFRDATSSAYLSARLLEEQQKELFAQIARKSLQELDEYYTSSQSTDQPTNELHVWIDGERKSVSVYGRLRREPEARAKTPPAFLRAFDAILKFSPEASPWTPNQLEVLIWPYEYSPEEPLSWPEGWPALESAQSRGTDGLHQIFLPRSEFTRLQQLLKDRKPKQAVKIGGRKWSIFYRMPFPREEEWVR